MEKSEREQTVHASFAISGGLVVVLRRKSNRLGGAGGGRARPRGRVDREDTRDACVDSMWDGAEGGDVTGRVKEVGASLDSRRKIRLHGSSTASSASKEASRKVSESTGG